jgi:uncharacterized membrane protein YbhN (UPF0104 family)
MAAHGPPGGPAGAGHVSPHAAAAATISVTPTGDAESVPGLRRRWWLPFHDPSRARRILKIAGWFGAVALVVGVLDLCGVDVGGWFAHLWRALTGVGFGYLVGGWTLVSIQTTLTALGWFFILRAGFPSAPVDFRQVLAAYATGVALNAFLPANIGTLVMLLMYVAIIPGANFAGMLGGMMVQKIFFTVASVFGYVYLFGSVRGTYQRQLKLPHDHPVLFWLIVLGGVLLIMLLIHIFWPRLKEQWEKTKNGSAILGRPREYLRHVALPSLGAWLSALAAIAVFLTAYGIPVSFNTVMWLNGGNSLAGAVALTPGGVGISQATNVAALSGVTDSATASAYSLGQQFAVTAWKILFALVLVIWALGWTRGRALIEQSYKEAKLKSADQRAEHERRRAARRGARA